ncbi:hypothetical protein [uncultured Selenomonas sp.]|uniref:hypothetical protein n=1 Tax=uncultured Selenomonas sp. TaxID=159275 RepID=UPI0025CF636D|nr:hypothetical protein [uncultured Selenomonas sp.]
MPRKAATTTKKTTTKTTAKTAAKTTVKKEAKAYVFFNCDEEKSDKSMNIDYNNEVFKDTVASRKALWAKIASEVEAGKVQVADEAAAKDAVLKGNPCDATQQLHYGAVKELLLH